MDKIALKSFTSNSRKLSRQKFYHYLACEFTAYSACRNTAMNLKCTTTNGLNFRKINSLIESYAWSGLAVKSARNGIMTVLELAAWIDHLRLSVDWEQVLQPSCATMPSKRPPNLGILRACLHDGGGPQVGEVTRVGGVTRLSIQSLILMWSRLHVRWGNPPHVTSPTWGPPPSCKQALSGRLREFRLCALSKTRVWLLYRTHYVS